MKNKSCKNKKIYISKSSLNKRKNKLKANRTKCNRSKANKSGSNVKAKMHVNGQAKKQTKAKKQVKQKGGIHIEFDPVGHPQIDDASKAFSYFLSQSTFTLKTTGSSNGIIIVAKLNEGQWSPYISIRPYTYNRKITELIIKLIFVDGPDELVTPIKNYPRITVEDFKLEVDIQLELFAKSCLEETSLEGLCPAIVFFSAPDKNRNINIIISSISAIIQRSDVQLATIMRQMLSVYTKPDVSPNIKLGIIAMESATGYETLHSLQNSPNYNEYTSFALYEIKRMHDLGFIHGDLHRGNILINTEYDYFDGETSYNETRRIKGRAMLIDFGRTETYDIPILINNNDNDNDRIEQIIELELLTTGHVHGTNVANRTGYIALDIMNPLQIQEKNYVWTGYKWMESYVINMSNTIQHMNELVTKREVMIDLFKIYLKNAYPNIINEIQLLDENMMIQIHNITYYLTMENGEYSSEDIDEVEGEDEGEYSGDEYSGDEYSGDEYSGNEYIGNENNNYGSHGGTTTDNKNQLMKAIKNYEKQFKGITAKQLINMVKNTVYPQPPSKNYAEVMNKFFKSIQRANSE